MNVFAKFDEIPSMILEVIKETKRYGHTVSRTDGRTTCKQYTLPQTQFAGDIIMATALKKGRCDGDMFWKNTNFILPLIIEFHHLIFNQISPYVYLNKTITILSCSIDYKRPKSTSTHLHQMLIMVFISS